MVLRDESHAHCLLRSRLTFFLGATLPLDAVATALTYVFEHAQPDSGFDDLGGALFWVSAQFTTVSLQLPDPVTTAGRALDLVLEAWAISVVATLAASLAAFFHTRTASRCRRTSPQGRCFPSRSGRGGSWRELDAEDAVPEPAGAIGIVGREFDQGRGHGREYGRRSRSLCFAREAAGAGFPGTGPLQCPAVIHCARTTSATPERSTAAALSVRSSASVPTATPADRMASA
jgi:hypothetical protein